MDSTTTTPQTPATPEVAITVTDQQNSALLDDTLAFFTAGNVGEASAQSRTELDRWAAVLAATERTGLAKIKLELRQLGELLGNAETPAHDIAEILASLGAETAKVAEDAGGDYSTPLASLSKQLIKTASQLSK